jgi:hypothetical protein
MVGRYHFDFDPERDRPAPVPPPLVRPVPVISLEPSGSTRVPNLVDSARGVVIYVLSFGFLQTVQHFLEYVGVFRGVLPPRGAALLVAVGAGVGAFIVSWLNSGYAYGKPGPAPEKNSGIDCPLDPDQ